MSTIVRSGSFALFVVAALAAGLALASGEGQEDLDKATEAKMNVKSPGDLLEVIRLCESALSKGLDKDNTEFAKKLLASTLIQRATLITRSILEGAPDPNWNNQRKVALSDLERAVKLDPSQPEAFFRIAQLNLFPGGSAKRAREALDRSIALNKDDPMLNAEALTLRAELEKDPKKQLEDLEQAVRLAPGDAAALRARGALLADLGQSAKALADFDAAMKIEARHWPTLVLKANVYAKMKKFDEARKTIRQARKIAPREVRVILAEAQIESIAGDHQAAVALLTEASRMEPSDVRALLMRSYEYEQLDESEKAMADLDRVLKLKPGEERAMRFRSALLVEAGHTGEAIDQLEEYLKDNPDEVEVRLQLASLYSLDGKHARAIEIYSGILAKDPKDWQALRGRADVYLSTGKHAEAIADFEKADKLNPHDSGILNNFAWVLATSPVDKLRNGKRAVKMAEEACKLTDYKQAHILSTLGAAYAEIGEFKTAMKWSAKAIAAGSEDQQTDLKKEMESYKAGKPIRELKTGNEPEDRPRPKRHKAAKPPTAKPAPQAAPAKPAAEEKSAKPKQKAEKKAEPKPAPQVDGTAV